MLEIGGKDLFCEFIEVIYDEGIAIFCPGHDIIEFCVLQVKWQKFKAFKENLKNGHQLKHMSSLGRQGSC